MFGRDIQPAQPAQLATQFAAPKPDTVAISAVIPCRNERDTIEACVRSLLAQQEPPGGMEIIIADGLSDDGTRDILGRLAVEDARVRVIDNSRQITPCGMNAGIRAARGQAVAIMGAHNRYAPDYLLRGCEVLHETEADNVGGAMRCESHTYLQSAIAAAHHSRFAVGGARWHDPSYEGVADTVFGGIYRAEVFQRIGVFDEELVRNQDDELNLRLGRAGGKIWQSPQIQSWYLPRSSLRALWRQYQQYGYWKVPVIQKHRLPASSRHLIPGGFVLSLLVLPVLALWWPLAGWVWLSLAGLYGLGNIIAAGHCASCHNWRLWPVLPLVFACYHFAYGIGFLLGVWDFFLLKREARLTSTKLTREATAH